MVESVVNTALNNNNKYNNIKILQQKFFLTENSMFKKEAVYNINLILKTEAEVKAKAKVEIEVEVEVEVKVKVKVKVKIIKDNISLIFQSDIMTSLL